jgi:hypothetical protein
MEEEKRPRPRFVGETEHKKLYHYEKFVAERLSATLRDKRIYCSNPAGFNDPWDCKPWFNAEVLEVPERLNRLLAFLRHRKDPGTDEAIINFWESRIRTKHYERVTLAYEMSEELTRTVHKRRIYCLTPCPHSTLMWSHYAENHKGICLEFSIHNPTFRMALEVLYPEHYPVWAIDDIEDQQNRAIDMILTKAKAWEYEHEFRLISPFDNEMESPLRVKDGCIDVPDGALTAVIAGCESDYVAIRAIVHAHMPQLPVKRIIRTPDDFTLKIIDIEDDG